MWIAKNDITGKEYGKKYKSIYDCQKYIDTDLLKLQFLYSMIVGLECDIKRENDFDDWYKDKYNDNDSVPVQFMARIEYGIKDLFNGLPVNPRNNVIRCWNTSQSRWADGFDF